MATRKVEGNLRVMDEVEVIRNGRTDQFSITLVRGADTIRCMVSVALGQRRRAFRQQEA